MYIYIYIYIGFYCPKSLYDNNNNYNYNNNNLAWELKKLWNAKVQIYQF